MSISTSISFIQNRDSIIKDALYTVGALGDGEVPDDDVLQLCSRALNRMIKSWESQGIHLFGLTEATLFLVLSQAQYALSIDSTSANATNTFNTTTTTTASAINATVIHITSNTNINNGDNIGIVLNTSAIWWTTVVSSTSTTVTLTSGIPSAAASGNYLYTYTTRINRPLRIKNARVFDVVTSVDVPLIKLSHQQYFDYPTKLTTGTQPVSFYYDPQLGIGQFYIWPTPTLGTKIIKFTYSRVFADMNLSTDNLDFPQEWLEAIILNLAVRIAPLVGYRKVGLELLPLANSLKEEMKDWDSEDSDVQFQPYGY